MKPFTHAPYETLYTLNYLKDSETYVHFGILLQHILYWKHTKEFFPTQHDPSSGKKR